jgi:hypothetical protein
LGARSGFISFQLPDADKPIDANMEAHNASFTKIFFISICLSKKWSALHQKGMYKKTSLKIKDFTPKITLKIPLLLIFLQ